MLAVVLVAVFSAAGCVSLKPVHEAAAGRAVGELVDVDGRRVHVVDRGRGPAVVLLHGFAASSFSWRHVVAGLEHDHRAIAPDLTGFGWSERPASRASYSAEAQAELVVGVMDVLGVETAHLVGHSYGGGIAQLVARERPGRLHSLSLIASTQPEYAHLRRRGIARVRPLMSLFIRCIALRPWFVRNGLEKSVYDPGVVTDEMVEGYLAPLKVEGVVTAYQGLTAPVPGPPPTVDPARLTLPVLAIWGREDDLIPLETAERALERVPQLRRVVLDECGHLPMEEQPKEVVAALRAFFREVDVAGDPFEHPQGTPIAIRHRGAGARSLGRAALSRSVRWVRRRSDARSGSAPPALLPPPHTPPARSSGAMESSADSAVPVRGGRHLAPRAPRGVPSPRPHGPSLRTQFGTTQAAPVSFRSGPSRPPATTTTPAREGIHASGDSDYRRPSPIPEMIRRLRSAIRLAFR